MSDHFDELEEKLRQLETIPLVTTLAQDRPAETKSGSAIERQSQVQPDSRTSQLKRHGGIDSASEDVLAVPPRSGWTAGLPSGLFFRRRGARQRALQAQAVSEYQNHLTQLLGSFIDDARRQLEALSEQWVPSFQMRMEKSIESSARNLSTELMNSLQQQVRVTAFMADVSPMWAGPESGEPTRVPDERQETVGVRPLLVDEVLQKRLMQAFSPVVDDVQAKSVAFLERVTAHLHCAVRTFGEKASSHVAEEFQRIAAEVFQSEAEHVQNLQSDPGTTDRNGQLAARENQAAGMQQRPTRPEGVPPISGTAQRDVKFVPATYGRALVWNPFQR
jgi:hypothetical protein